MKKSKLLKIAWNGEKIGREQILEFLAPRQKNVSQKWKKSKLLEISWNGDKIGRKQFLDFLPPHPKKNRLPKKKFQHMKIVQNCLKRR